MNAVERYKSWTPYFLSILRAIAGFLMMAHGAQKLFGVLGKDKVELMSQAGLAGVLEFFGGVLLILGLFTRPVAFILAGTMAVAYFQVHAPQGFWPIVNKGELAVLYCFVFLFLSAAGAGPWSLDALMSRGHKTTVSV
jgi:putative oxidoreductase